MKKSKTPEVKLSLKKPIKYEPPKSKLKLKTHIYRRLTLKHNSNNKTYTNKMLDSLIFNKNTHISVAFKDDIMFEFLDEFLKRFYKFVESKERVPKIANYYKNYLTFFCNPIFRNFKINGIIQQYSDNKAEFYYNKTYSKKKEKDKKATSFLFNTRIKQDIDEVILTQLTEANINVNNDCNNNSIFNDEFFIYRPEKKRYVDGNLDNSSHLALDYSRNCTMKSGLLTLQSNEDDIFSIVSNLGNQPLNEKIFDKIQQKTKKIVKNNNFSTTDKTKESKGDSQNINKISGHITGNKHESYQLQEIMNKKENNDHDSNIIMNNQYNYINFNNPDKISKEKETDLNSNSRNPYNINMRNPSPITPIQPTPVTPMQHDGMRPYYGIKNVHEVIDAAKQLIPNSSKNKLGINNQDSNSNELSKLPYPTTVKQQKPILNSAITTLKNSNSNNKIEFKTMKMKASNSGTKFANLLYASSETNLKLAGNQIRVGSNPHGAKIPSKAIRNIDIIKYGEDIKSPANYQANNLQDIRHYDLHSKVKNEADDNFHLKPTLSVHLDKVFKVRQPSYENFVASTTRPKQKPSDKISYNYLKEEELIEEGNKIKKIRTERSSKQLQNRDNRDNRDIRDNNNANFNNNSKIVNYLNNSKKIICTGASDDSHRVLSSLANTKTTINNGNQMKIKYSINEKTPSNQVYSSNIHEGGKIKIQSKYFHIEQKALASTRNYNKSKENIVNDVKINKTPVNHNRIKSVDYYSNNYVSNNVHNNANHNENINSFLNKIASTRHINPTGDMKSKKINFSPQNVYAHRENKKTSSRHNKRSETQHNCFNLGES